MNFKLQKWWTYKIGAGVFTLLLFKLIFSKTQEISFTYSDLLLFLILILLAISGHLVNDFFDIEADKKAVKSNLLSSYEPKKAMFIVLLFCFSVLLLSFFTVSNVFTVLVGLQLFFSFLYSSKFTRLKEKGVWALLITGLYERSFPYFLILVYVFPRYYQNISELQTAVLICYFVWAYLWECRNFLNGQVADIENDKVSKTKSIAIALGSKKLKKLKFFLIGIEILILFSWLFLGFQMMNPFALIGAFILPFFHRMLQSENKLFDSIENYLSYVYNSSLLFCFSLYLMIHNLNNWFIFVTFIILFRSSYVKSSSRMMYVKIFIPLYYSFRFVGSKIVNYTIYYFRRYILRWSEEKAKK